MDTRSPTELSRQKPAAAVLKSSDVSLLLAKNEETLILVKSQNELINTLLNKQTEMEEKINRQEHGQYFVFSQDF